MSKLIVRDRSSVREFGAPGICQHTAVHEIGCDFDKDGMLLRLIRCQKCGLLMRQYLPMVCDATKKTVNSEAEMEAARLEHAFHFIRGSSRNSIRLT